MKRLGKKRHLLGLWLFLAAWFAFFVLTTYAWVMMAIAWKASL